MEAVFYFRAVQNNNNPIGVFDSGVGGTSIWKEICLRMPNEATIYLADSVNAPYGDKPEHEIIRLSVKNTKQLLAMGAKIIVVACNTATTNAIAHLRATYPVPFIGIEPAIKPAALKSKTKAIGILATRGTLNSRLFEKTSNLYKGDTKVIEVIGKGLVPLIEQGKIQSNEIRSLLKTYLNPMIEASVDHIVLGCSHYPYLIPILKELLPAHIKIIDSGEAVAIQTQSILSRERLLADTNAIANHHLYTNTTVDILKQFIPKKGINTDFLKVSYLNF